MVSVGAEQVASLMVGEMGVKDAYVGETPVYARTGGYIYLILETDTTKENANG